MSEEINISGSGPLPSSTKSADAPATVNHMQQHVGNIGQFSGASPDQILDEILNAPREQLIPWEECHLPSRGIYYDWPDGIIQVRAMGQTAEKYLANQRLTGSGQVLDMVFADCCQFPAGFDASQLLLGDRTFLLYFLRGITHGNVYEFAIKCPNQACEATSTHVYDLNQLAQTMIFANQSIGREPFKVSLPYLSKVTGRDFWVGIRFLRAFDAMDILNRRKVKDRIGARPGGVRTRSRQPVDTAQQNQQRQQMDDTISDNMEKLIVSVMGVGDVFKIRGLIERLHATDTAAIREWLREYTPGIDNTVTITCPDCRNEFVVELPITDSFFHPSKS